MPSRTVRPDRCVESISQQLKEKQTARPIDIYSELDLGPGGYSRSPSTRVNRGVNKAIREKLLK